MTWILGLLLASSAIFNKALVLTYKTQITLASPALHAGLNVCESARKFSSWFLG